MFIIRHPSKYVSIMLQLLLHILFSFLVLSSPLVLTTPKIVQSSPINLTFTRLLEQLKENLHSTISPSLSKFEYALSPLWNALSFFLGLVNWRMTSNYMISLFSSFTSRVWMSFWHHIQTLLRSLVVKRGHVLLKRLTLHPFLLFISFLGMERQLDLQANPSCIPLFIIFFWAFVLFFLFFPKNKIACYEMGPW